jgi:hypothetical protein
MLSIERGDLDDSQPLGRRDHGCIGGSERQIGVPHELGDPHPISRTDGLGDEIAGREITDRPEKLELWVRPQPSGVRAEHALAWAREIKSRYGDLFTPPTALRNEP